MRNLFFIFLLFLTLGAFAAFLYLDYDVALLQSFLNIYYLAFIIAGVIFSLFVVFSPRHLIETASALKKSFSHTTFKEQNLCSPVKNMALLARSDGLLALERIKNKNTFFERVINLVTRGYTIEKICPILKIEANTNAFLNKQAARVFKTAGIFCILFGAIASTTATLLAKEQAFLPLLYSFILTGFIFLPLSYRLKEYARAIYRQCDFLVLATECIVKSEHPDLVEEKLSCFIANAS